jgi:hypothetical protein
LNLFSLKTLYGLAPDDPNGDLTPWVGEAPKFTPPTAGRVDVRDRVQQDQVRR